MIQRIQTIYLLLTAILLGVAMCYPIGVFVGADGVSTSVFTPVHLVLADGTSQLTIGMIGLLLSIRKEQILYLFIITLSGLK